jgi:plastocyanin
MLRRVVTCWAALGLLAACGGGGASNAAANSAATPAQSVSFKETEYTIQPASVTLRQGTYSVTVQNLGQFPHDLHIAAAEDGTEVGYSPVVKPNESATFRVTLKAGDYVTWCAVDGHKALGMNGTLTAS